MVLKALKIYRDSFAGLRREVWWLALVTLINRAGTMVLPFMSLYLTAELDFTLEHVGWIMSAFGLGSLAGSWLGGRLTDIWGFYPVMFWSLVISGIMFIGLQQIRSFEGFAAGVFLVMVAADCFRPAGYVAINAYSKPENRTRSATLIRLAINLGFSVGPAAGGLIITGIGYGGLFWADGLTCMAAGILLLLLLQRKRAERDPTEEEVVSQKSPYGDKPYLLFLFITMLIGFAFLQYFSTIPLYYRDIHFLSEKHIGWLMAMNGFLIFLVEMPLVKYFDQPKFSMFSILIGSTLLFALSFLVLNLTPWAGVLVVGMVFMSIAETLNFPFLNRFALERAERGKSGSYMALFTMSFSVSHILGQNSGMQLVAGFGYDFTWYLMTGALVLAALLLIPLKIMMKKEAAGVEVVPG